MPLENQAAEGKALSVEDAVALLDEQPSSVSESKAEPEATGTEPVEGGPSNQPEPDAEESRHEAEAEVHEAPRSWDETARALFSQVPADLQAIIVSHERDHRQALDRARTDAENAKQEIDKRVVAQIAEYKVLLDRLVPEVTKTLRSRWADIDWTTLPEKVGTEEAFRLKAQYDKERDQLQQLEGAQRVTEQRAHADFVKTETAKLKDAAPDLADNEKGQGRREALGRFLVGQGYTGDQIRFMTANDAAIAYDAMRWREAQARARAQARAKPLARSAPPSKPVALPSNRAPLAKKSDDALRRLTKTGRIDDAVAYLNARSK